LKYNNVN